MRCLVLFALLLLLLLAWTEAKRPHQHHHQHCFNPEDVQEGDVPTEFLSKSKRWERHSAVQLVPYLEKEAAKKQRQRRHQEFNCPTLQLQDLRHSSVQERSISPWSHRIDEDKNRTPSRLAFAYCLCRGCINTTTGLETTDLNSVLIHQEMMVLRRKPCPHDTTNPNAFTLEVDYIKVPVACACVLPEYSS